MANSIKYSECDVPVLLLAFRRPDSTYKVLKSLSAVKPKQLFIACDGARTAVPGEIEKCDEVKRVIENEISWNCEVKKLYRLKNLGCGKAVSEAINWFFSYVAEGIILEDDTVPNQAFFQFAEAMLDKYKDNSRVMHISGINFKGREEKKHPYYFSKYSHIWGWATWKRAWDKYDFSITKWPEYKHSNAFKNWCISQKEAGYWTKKFDEMCEGKVDTWDYQWLFAIMYNNGLCIMPTGNMVSNIGFNTEATHTKTADERFANKPVYALKVNSDYNIKVLQDINADKITFATVYDNEFAESFNIKSIKTRLLNKVKAYLG